MKISTISYSIQFNKSLCKQSGQGRDCVTLINTDKTRLFILQQTNTNSLSVCSQNFEWLPSKRALRDRLTIETISWKTQNSHIKY